MNNIDHIEKRGHIFTISSYAATRGYQLNFAKKKKKKKKEKNVCPKVQSTQMPPHFGLCPYGNIYFQNV